MLNLFIKKIKENLEAKRKIITAELQRFARKDNQLQHDWDTRFPRFDSRTESQTIEDKAGEVEEYSSLLPVEYSLELRLRDINLALEKIKKGRYGKCEKCGKNIAKERLKVAPEARTCTKCK